MAPRGHTAAQKVRPHRRVAIRGIAKTRMVAGRIAAAGSTSASATFWMEPTGQTQPSRMNPNQTRQAMARVSSPARLRRR